jgi:hypothetical protein
MNRCSHVSPDGYRCSGRVWKDGELLCFRHDMLMTLENWSASHPRVKRRNGLDLQRKGSNWQALKDPETVNTNDAGN